MYVVKVILFFQKYPGETFGEVKPDFLRGKKGEIVKSETQFISM